MKTTTTYKCKNCGGGLVYDPSTNKLKCEYCLTKYEESDFVKEVTTKEKELIDTYETKSKEVFNQYRCPNCGAEVLTDETTAATFCYYCHSPVILNGKISGKYIPDEIIPFSIDRKEAISIFKKWIAKKRYLVPGFYSKQQVEKIIGIYMPYWLVSCTLDGSIEAVSKQIQRYTIDGTTYIETTEYQTDRNGELYICNMPNMALSSEFKDVINNVFPFNLKELIPFNKKYFLGFQAEKRNLGKKYFEEEICSDVRKLTSEALKESILGYDKVKVKECFIHINKINYNYVMLPVYVLTYQHKGEMFYFALNGQTGKVVGKLPFDNTKLVIHSTIIFAVLFIALLILGLKIW